MYALSLFLAYIAFYTSVILSWPGTCSLPSDRGAVPCSDLELVFNWLHSLAQSQPHLLVFSSMESFFNLALSSCVKEVEQHRGPAGATAKLAPSSSQVSTAAGSVLSFARRLASAATAAFPKQDELWALVQALETAAGNHAAAEQIKWRRQKLNV
jgi:hypothetical protein